MNQTITIESQTDLESYFKPFREQIIGHDTIIKTPYGKKPLVYLDWTASGRLYEPIEQKIRTHFGPYVANTHTETTTSGTLMTKAYKKAKEIIKHHVNASTEDVLILDGTGMTGVINKLQRILGLRIPDKIKAYTHIPEELKPVVFISHMEHHSNHTSWLETIAKVEIIPHDEDGLICIDSFEKLLIKYKDKSYKIASVTACSNVTGIQTPYYEIANLIHKAGGYCFVDFACSGPYVTIDMHPTHDEYAYLDAIFFSPHKFLGGPGTSGALIFNKKLYNNNTPDNPGGGTVTWTNPWGDHKYIEEIEEREDGGTPGFLQAIKAAYAVKLKEKMGTKAIGLREKEIIKQLFTELSPIKEIEILAKQHQNRLGVFSFYIHGLHFNLAVKLLNDKFGIQTRGGCSCAGTYGHFLLHIDQKTSAQFLNQIEHKKTISRPGWIRLSIHPTTSNNEITYAIEAIKELCKSHIEWSKDYEFNPETNNFTHIHEADTPYPFDTILHFD